MKLEILCRYRAQREDYIRLELVELDHRLEAAVMARSCREEAAERHVTRYLAQTRSGMQGHEVELGHAAYQVMQGDVDRADTVVGQVVQARDQKQSELVEAMRERKQMELLVERRMRQRRARAKVREQREMDDFANGRWAMTVAEQRRGEDER